MHSHSDEQPYPEPMGNILLVDDDPTVRGVVSDYLRAAGHSITEVSDGISALELADGCDLVILDLMLPGIDGLEVFRRIRSRGVVAPVIMLTAKGSEADRVLVMSVNPGFGGQSFIPATLEKLKQARKRIDESGLDIRLEVDGGVKASNIAEIARAGADMFVAGSAIFDQPDYKKVIDEMRQQLAAVGK